MTYTVPTRGQSGENPPRTLHDLHETRSKDLHAHLHDLHAAGTYTNVGGLYTPT
jgi:hypothetical protein